MAASSAQTPRLFSATPWATGQPAPSIWSFWTPPFRQDLAEESCRQLVDGGLLAAGAWVYLEVEAKLTPSVPADWMLHREVRAGDSCGRLYRLP